MNSRLAIVAALIVAFMLGGWIGDEFRPKPDRPVLRFLAKAARTAMWIMLVESATRETEYTRAAPPDPDHIDHARSL
jgi:NADH:ubiquinone oxidoreductase subunit H